MNLFIDTVNEDLFISIVKDNNTLAFRHLSKHNKKSDILPKVYKEIIEEAKIKTKDISKIFVVNGPGSFMGIRAGIVFAKTISLMLDIKLYSIDNLTFISKKIDGKYYVDAKGQKSYIGIVKNNKIDIKIGEFQENSVIEYKELIENPKIYFKLFKLVDNLIEFQENYIKEPRIGGI